MPHPEDDRRASELFPPPYLLFSLSLRPRPSRTRRRTLSDAMVALDSSALIYKILADVSPGAGSSSSSTAGALAAAATGAAGGHGSTSTGGAGGTGQLSDAKRQKLLQHARSECASSRIRSLPSTCLPRSPQGLAADSLPLRRAGYAEYYVEIAAAFLGLLVLRNVALKLSRAYTRRQRQKAVDAAGEKGAAAVPFKHSALVRAVHAVDRAALTPVPFLPSEWSVLRVGLIVIDVMLCLVFSLVRPSCAPRAAQRIVAESVTRVIESAYYRARADAASSMSAGQRLLRHEHGQDVRRPLRPHRDGRPPLALPLRRAQQHPHELDRPLLPSTSLTLALKLKSPTVTDSLVHRAEPALLAHLPRRALDDHGHHPHARLHRSGASLRSSPTFFESFPSGIVRERASGGAGAPLRG